MNDNVREKSVCQRTLNNYFLNVEHGTEDIFVLKSTGFNNTIFYEKH